MAKKKKKQTVHRRSPCPVACTLDLLGDKWTLLVIRDLVCGKSQYKEFLASPEGIATNILADRLARLVEHGLAEKYPLPEQPGRDVYRLTQKGQSLRPVMMSLVKWGLENIDGTEARMTPKIE
ncbi:putative HTH-type transcriptional regulator YybR [Stieleria neptunia]|uniref:Putative HTH-type transcriptional regulator YybR n=1 Tax=Stieleria neptunia TaxID=2527979 RepID=A0A518HWS1_9BACT|nr:helix-turn-helix domain-containing protein [Stieleria neptunia]QDV45306.1 putative HTH-type transcriptional regulator YybR [Stieleria neptunia]